MATAQIGPVRLCGIPQNATDVGMEICPQIEREPTAGAAMMLNLKAKHRWNPRVATTLQVRNARAHVHSAKNPSNMSIMGSS